MSADRNVVSLADVRAGKTPATPPPAAPKRRRVKPPQSTVAGDAWRLETALKLLTQNSVDPAAVVRGLSTSERESIRAHLLRATAYLAAFSQAWGAGR